MIPKMLEFYVAWESDILFFFDN